MPIDCVSSWGRGVNKAWFYVYGELFGVLFNSELPSPSAEKQGRKHEILTVTIILFLLGILAYHGEKKERGLYLH